MKRIQSPYVLPQLARIHQRNSTKNFSLIIPVFNEEKNLANVLRIATNSMATEILVIDDGSKDKSAQIITEWAVHNPRIKLISHESNKGPSAARCTGIHNSAYDVVVFLDADLFNIDEKTIDKLAQPVIEGEVDLVIADFLLDGRVTELCARPLLMATFPDLAKLGQPLSGQLCARKSALFPERLDEWVSILGLILDAYLSGAIISEVQIGNLEHSHRESDVKKRQAQNEAISFIKRYEEYLAYRMAFKKRLSLVSIFNTIKPRLNY